MSDFNFEVKEVKLNCGANIKVIGVGGCGSNMVNNMIESSKYTDSVEIIVANTDIQDLEKSKSEIKLQLGKNITGGRGAGAKPEIGLKSAEEAEEDIRKCLEGANLVFLTVGLGGGTGTGAAPFIARLAKEMGILVIGIATMPQEFERRTKKAKKGLEEFKKECDSVILVHNSHVDDLAEDLTFDEGMRLVDNILLDAVESMLSILLNTGGANVDFADVQTIMTFRGLAQIGSGKGQGENAVSDAFIEAFKSPLLDSAGQDHSKAKGFLCFISYGSGIAYRSLNRAISEHSSEFDEDIEYIYGHVCDPKLAEDEAHVIVMLTGFDNEEAKEENIMEQPIEQPSRLIRREEFELLRTGTNDGYMSVEDYKSMDYSIPAYRRRQQD